MLSAGRNWLRESLLWLGVGALGSLLLLLVLVGWRIAGKPVAGTEGLVAQMGMLVALAQAILAFIVACATVYYAIRTGQMVALMTERDETEARRARRARVDALVGASLEAAGYCGWMAELQRQGLRPLQKILPEPVARRELVIAAWRELSSAVIAASRALESIRYQDLDLADAARDHHSLVLDLQLLASEGKTKELQERVKEVRTSADRLWDAVGIHSRP